MRFFLSFFHQIKGPSPNATKLLLFDFGIGPYIIGYNHSAVTKYSQSLILLCLLSKSRVSLKIQFFQIFKIAQCGEKLTFSSAIYIFLT